MLFSELGSVRSVQRFPSVCRDYAAVVLRASVTQQYPYIGSCRDVRRTCTKSFSVVSFTQIKKVFTKARALPNFSYSLLAHCKCARRQLLW